ncbi:MAG: hypothetical protein IT369_03920 [Candidatus Latescibacteria bacterium]|nr:hypothetical protein [Candidatus Latescibacterota bacterium]
MFWPLLFGCFLLVVVALWYFRSRAEVCPQCSAPREPDHPLCSSCGWIYEVPGDADDDYGDADDEEVRV